MGKLGVYFTHTTFNRGNSILVRLSTFLLMILYLLTVCSACSETAEKQLQPFLFPRHPFRQKKTELASLIDKAQKLLAEGMFRKAVTVCQDGLVADSTSVLLLNTMATAYASEGRYALAIEALDQIRILEPTRALTYLNLWGIFTKLGQYEQAEPPPQQALQIAPNQPEIHRRLW